MKLSELGRLVAQHLAQGKADWEVHIFQWDHQSQPVTDFLERPGILEFYSGTEGLAQVIDKAEQKQAIEYDEIEDLI